MTACFVSKVGTELISLAFGVLTVSLLYLEIRHRGIERALSETDRLVDIDRLKNESRQVDSSKLRVLILVLLLVFVGYGCRIGGMVYGS